MSFSSKWLDYEEAPPFDGLDAQYFVEELHRGVGTWGLAMIVAKCLWEGVKHAGMWAGSSLLVGLYYALPFVCLYVTWRLEARYRGARRAWEAIVARYREYRREPKYTPQPGDSLVVHNYLSVRRALVDEAANAVVKLPKITPKVVERCHRCELAAVVVLGDSSIAERMDKINRERGEANVEHVCPLDEELTRDKPIPPTYIARLLGEACSLQLEDLVKKLEQLEGPEAGGGKHSGKMLKRIAYREGQSRPNRKYVSPQDYERIDELLEEGFYFEACVEYINCAEDRNGSGFEGTSADAFRDAMRVMDRRIERHEMGGLAITAAHNYRERYNRNQFAEAALLVDGETSWTEVTATRLEAYMADCAVSQAAHDEAVAARISRGETNPESVAPKAFRHQGTQSAGADVKTASVQCGAMGKSRGVQCETLPEEDSSSDGGAVHKKRSRRKKKAVEPERVAESAVAGNTAIKLANVAHITFERGHAMNGFLSRASGSRVLFTTGRHCYRDGKVADYFTTKPETMSGVVRTANGRTHEVTCTDFRSDNDVDRVQFRVQSDTLRFEDVPSIRFARARPGKAVTAAYMRDGEWEMIGGVVAEVLKSGVVAYEMTTAGGCCRMPVFQDGAVVAGHYFAGINTPAGRVPGGFPEDGKELRKWDERPYNPPKSAQAAGPVGRQFQYIREEEFKINGLRKDIPLKGVKTPFFMAKPSTEMLHKEVRKFLTGECKPKKLGAWRAACQALLFLEKECSTPFREPDLEDWIEVVRSMDGEHTNAGADAVGLNQHEYLVTMGDGDLEAGVLAVAQKVQLDYMDLVANGEAAQCIETMRIWMVQGKRDGYKLKKLDQGRSIQAPTFTMKAIWKACFGGNDKGWVCRDTYFRTGRDFDLPVEFHHAAAYAKARSAVGLDETEFDRGIDRDMLSFFFHVYMPLNNPGVPDTLLRALFKCTADGMLVLTDGEGYLKDHGNPSGFPNTLRLNCVIQLLSWLYIIALLLDVEDWEPIFDFFADDIYLEICGDDSRCWVMTARGADVLGESQGFTALLEAWAQWLPWAVKIEGQVVYQGESFAERMNMAPPLIARKLVWIDGLLWSPLYNVNRVCRKLVSAEKGRDHEVEEALRTSFFTTMAPVVYWHEVGAVCSPTVQTFIDAGWYTPERRRMVHDRVSDLYRYGTLYVGRARLSEICL